MSENQLQRVEHAPPAFSTGAIIEKIVESGIGPQQIEVLERMMVLKYKEDDRNAEKDFIAAFALLQRQIPHIKATYAVPTANGGVKFRGAHLIDIMRQVEPLLADHGFSIMFESASSAGDAESRTVSQTCVLMHVGGHSKKSTSCVRVGGRFDSSAQMDAGAYTTAKRLAVCDLLNIHVDRSDVAILGDFITAEQAAEFSARVTATGSDKAKFLALAQAESFEAIRTAKVGVLDKMLRTKEKAKQPTA
jgi:hypothetical protein